MKKIKYINQFSKMDHDNDSNKFITYSNKGINYPALGHDVPYQEDEYITFVSKYSPSFKLEFTYEKD